METLAIWAGADTPRWCEAFAAAAPQLRVLPADDPAARDAAWLAAWKPPAGLFARLPALRAVFALGAGVDRFLRQEDLRADVALVRLCDAGMAEQMVEYALVGVLARQRRLPDYAAHQAARDWHPLPAPVRAELRVGVLGLGAIGGVVAQALARMGYAVAGWSRGIRALEGVECLAGAAGLDRLLARSDVAIVLLPATADTRGLLDARRLRQLPAGAYLVNAARGEQVDATAVLALLEAGHLSGALLDVFATEPLPADSPLWRHPRVTITPHVAATTQVGPAVAQVLAAIATLRTGNAPPGLVDRVRGY